MSLALLFPYLLLNMFRMLIHPSLGACDLPLNIYANASTSILTEQYNPCNNASNESQAPEDGCINIRNMLSSK